MIGDICQPIETLPDYPHYNGWQLNTVFFIAGPKINQEYKFKFTLKNEGTTTGWACIDEFKIYKVNGSYATQNETALGVTSIIDQNSDSDTLDIPNGNFDLGKTADTVTVGGSSYPYPLVANNWETNTDTNGIVNLHATLWDDRFGEHPDQINNYDNSEYGNHVYMMHNTTPNQNILTSPVLTTKKGESTYISFDAYSTAPTTAYIFCDFTDTDGNTTNELILGKSIKINNDNWTRYEFEIIEDEFTSSRNYYLRFKMEGIGYTYIDNVRTVSTTSPTSIIDLTNILPIQDAWQTTNEIEFKYLYANGLYLQNIDEQKTIVENTISYDLTANEYFELIIEASGKNAYLGLSNYTGLLEVTSDDNDDNIEKPTKEYKLYLQAGDATTTVKIQTTLGITANEDITTNGEIFIKNIELNKIEKEEFDLAKTNSEHNNCIKILTASEEQDTEEEEEETTTADQNDFFGENWWFLIPSLITAIALFLGIAAFLLRKIKFDRHIVKKTTSYARDMRLKNQQNKIVAQKAAKVDNVVDESKNN